MLTKGENSVSPIHVADALAHVPELHMALPPESAKVKTLLTNSTSWQFECEKEQE